MLRKALTLGMVFILALSLLAASMITCFTYDAGAHLVDIHQVEDDDPNHGHFTCCRNGVEISDLHSTLAGWACTWSSQ